MRLAILCQEEPISLGPFLQQVIAMRPESIAAVFIAGRRGAGEPSRSWRERLTALRIFWLLMEPAGFLGALVLRLRARLLGRHDPRSVERTARRFGVPVHHVGNPNQAAFHELLGTIAPDAVLNQSEFLLRSEVLSIPRLGFLNRHASLLPHFRGRMACFWSHAAQSPRYGVTIHFVDEGVDTGPIIAQQELQNLDARWPYPKIMKRVFAIAPALFWEAVDWLDQDGFEPLANTPVDEPLRFPTLAEASRYRRRVLRRRRTVEDGPFVTHFLDARRIGKYRRRAYLEMSRGRTRGVSVRVSLLEAAILPIAAFVDWRAERFHTRGIPIVSDDLVSMDGVRPLTSPPEYGGKWPDELGTLAKEAVREYRFRLRECLRAYEFAAAAELSRDMIRRIDDLQARFDCHLAMTRHFVESILRGTHNAPRYAAMSDGDTRRLSRFFAAVQAFGLPIALHIDKQAQPCHRMGIGIIVNDMPPIETPR